jgi:hypothetical protein
MNATIRWRAAAAVAFVGCMGVAVLRTSGGAGGVPTAPTSSHLSAAPGRCEQGGAWATVGRLAPGRTLGDLQTEGLGAVMAFSECAR